MRSQESGKDIGSGSHNIQMVKGAFKVASKALTDAAAAAGSPGALAAQAEAAAWARVQVHGPLCL